MTVKTFHALAIHSEHNASHALVGLADHGTEPDDYLVVMRGLEAKSGVPDEIVSSVYVEFGGETMAGQGCLTRVMLRPGQLTLHIDRKRCKHMPHKEIIVTFEPEQALEARLEAILRIIMPDEALLQIKG